MPQEIISPMPTVSIKYQIVPGKPYVNFKISGITTVFDKIGGISAIYGIFFSLCVKNTPIKVAKLPKTISKMLHPVRIFDKKQPVESPKTADGVKIAREYNASESRH